MGQRGADDASKVEMNRGQRRSKPFERVRRPADLLLALFALALIATVLGLIRTLPIGSTELSNDVTRWLFHVPRWLSSSAEVVAAIGGLALVVVALVVLLRSERRGALNAGAAAGAAAVATTAASIAWHARGAQSLGRSSMTRIHRHSLSPLLSLRSSSVLISFGAHAGCVGVCSLELRYCSLALLLTRSRHLRWLSHYWQRSFLDGSYAGSSGQHRCSRAPPRFDRGFCPTKSLSSILRASIADDTPVSMEPSMMGRRSKCGWRIATPAEQG